MGTQLIEKRSLSEHFCDPENHIKINANITANKLKICNAETEGQAKKFNGT
jgi:hypothetical protein